ncbi:MAG: 23S rRNA (guanosine(2251)-2'-O)-methyltransferase RlmB [Actinobacteria bacterium]|nr:23S rRNA (guanosine(2251)-2'-O)-methyltransferase RlmB [Actinomycetota bacterium]
MKELPPSFSAPLSANHLKKLRRLKQKKYRDKENLFLAEGVRLCEEALKSRAQIVEVIFCPALVATERMQKILQRAHMGNIPVYHTGEKEFHSFSETETPQGMAFLVRHPSWNFDSISERKKSLLLALDAIQDPGNLGTILRTAEWFAADGVLLGKGCVDVYNSKVVRSSMGAVFHIPVFENISLENALPAFKKKMYRIIGTRAESGNETQSGLDGNKRIILMGNEANGLTASVAAHVDDWITISGKGKSESLNVAVAAGIILYLLGNSEKVNG